MAWTLGTAARTASEAVPSSQLPYNGAGPWVDPCVNLSTIPRHMLELIRQMRAHAPWVRKVSPIRACERRRDGTLSMHATGRAADVMVPVISGPEGEELANWLVQNAKPLGVQLVIWDRMAWQGSSPVARRFAPYAGPNPHINHVHVELTSTPGPMLAPPAPLEPIAPQTMAFLRSMIVPMAHAPQPPRSPAANVGLALAAGVVTAWAVRKRENGGTAPLVTSLAIGALTSLLLMPTPNASETAPVASRRLRY